MAGINFLDFASDDNIIHEKEFGICDDADESPSYYSTNQIRDHWVATVSNPGTKAIQFLPVDKHIPLRRLDGTDAKRCDAMLLSFPHHTKESVVFIELKEERTSNNKRAIEQLDETIAMFKAYHLLDAYKKRVAYVVNRRHPKVHNSTRKEIIDFRTNHRIRLIFSANVIF